METISWKRRVNTLVDEYVTVVVNGGTEPTLWLSFPSHDPSGPMQFQHVIPYEQIEEFAAAVGRASREAKYRKEGTA